MKEHTLQYRIPIEYEGYSVQDYLRQAQNFSRRILIRLKKVRGDILCNGEHIRLVDPVHTGDLLTAVLRDHNELLPNAALEVPIVYEDDDVMVFDKPAAMPVHPSRNHQEDTLANVFTHLMQQRGCNPQFRAINRLDRDTSGLCVVAKNALAAGQLTHHLSKQYTAILCGVLPCLSGTISAPIARPTEFAMNRVVRADGQRAVTDFVVTAKTAHYTQVLVNLQTGRTHQIRVHFSDLGYPLVGDSLYGATAGTEELQGCQALCCTQVRFAQPTTGKMIHLCINIHSELDIFMKNG